MADLVTSINGFWGRSARIVLGLALTGYGLVGLGGTTGNTTGVAVAVVGVLPVALGLWGRCLLEPFCRVSP